MSNIVELTDHSVVIRCPTCSREIRMSGCTFEAETASRYSVGHYCENRCGCIVWCQEARRILHERKFGRQLPLPLEVAP